MHAQRWLIESTPGCRHDSAETSPERVGIGNIADVTLLELAIVTIPRRPAKARLGGLGIAEFLFRQPFQKVEAAISILEIKREVDGDQRF